VNRRIFLLACLLPSISLAGPFSNVGRNPEKEAPPKEEPPKKEECKHVWGDWSPWKDSPPIPIEGKCLIISMRWHTCKKCLSSGHDEMEREVPCPPPKKPDPPACK